MVSFEGWIESVKIHKDVAFLILRYTEKSDIGCIYSKVQFITKQESKINLLKTVLRESYVKIEGVKEESDLSKNVSYVLCTLEIIKSAIELKGQELNKPMKKLDYGYHVLNLRRPEFHQILKVRYLVYQVIRQVMKQKNIFEITSPKLSTCVAESGSQVFKTLYFGKELVLSQSPQFYKQLAINGGLEAVYQITPIFRAEKFNTNRHLCESISWDVELRNPNYEILFDLIKEVFIKIFEKVALLLPVEKITVDDFCVIKHKEALKLLGLPENSEITNELQKKIVKLMEKKFVFITEFPFFQKPFYAHKEDTFDLIGPLGELCSGGTRENDYYQLIQNLEARQIDPNKLNWFLDSFKLGNQKSSGFGLGLDRLIQLILNLTAIHDTKIFPCI